MLLIGKRGTRSPRFPVVALDAGMVAAGFSTVSRSGFAIAALDRAIHDSRPALPLLSSYRSSEFSLICALYSDGIRHI